jgi:hypothetical protein
MRHVILHYHIYKNAGCTVYAALQKALGATACERFDSTQPRCVLSAQQMLDFVLKHPRLRVVTSHQARLPMPELEGITFHPVVFLRHPIDRVGSVYAYERRLPAGEDLIAAMARTSTFADYVRWRLLPGNGSVIRNFQTAHLAGGFDDMRTAFATRSDLAIAMQRLQELPTVGLVEDVPGSLRKLQTVLQSGFGTLELTATLHNASVERDTTLNVRLASIERELGPTLYAELLDNNRLDPELYTAAVKSFELDRSGAFLTG